MATAAGIALNSSGGVQNGAVVDIWLASRFTGTPVFNASPPTGSADGGPVTAGTNFGAPGAWQITGLSDASYYVRTTYGGNSSWSGPYAIEDDADLVHRAGAETLTGLKTFSAGLTVSGGTITLPAGSISPAAVGGGGGPLPIASGGTGSAVQNFVDLSSAQSVAGVKTFSAIPVFSAGFSVPSGGTITLPNGSIPFAAVAGLSTGAAGVDLGSTQVLTGQKTMQNDLPLVGGRLLGSALATPAAPVVTRQGTAGTTTYSYQIVATSYDGRDSIPSPTGQTTTGNATLSGTNYNALTWSAVTAAASYKVLKFVSGTWQLLAGGITGTTYSDTGSATPTAYTVSTVNPGGELQGTATTVTSLTSSGPVIAQTVQANAATGGVTAARFIGMVPIGGPTSPYVGTVGDWGMDSAGHRWVCTAVGTPGTWIAPDPWGLLPSGYVQTLSNSATFTTLTTLLSVTVTITASNRRVRVSGEAILSNTTTADIVQLGIYQSTTPLMLANAPIPVANQNASPSVRAIVQPAAGSQTYQLTGARGGSTGTLQMLAGTGFPAWLMVEDIGPN
jgi:hypothetical protein